MSATDADIGRNAEISYSIDNTQGNASDLFKIHISSGQISTKTELTGNIGHFHVVAVATDGGSPSLSNVTDVFIFVEDVNDHAPVIYEPADNETIYMFEVCLDMMLI